MGNTHSFVTVPTADELNLFSLSYKGLSGRKEMFCMLGWYFFLKAVLKYGALKLFAGWMLDISASCASRFIPLALLFYAFVIGLFCILFVMPLFVRRARQMGAAWYGVLVIVLHCLPVLGAVWLAKVGSFEGDPRALAVVWSAVLAVIASLPLYVYGGTFSGKKTELMRAAIAGDRERAERLLAYFPSGLMKKSEKGYTPCDYALKAGHKALADWFRELEEKKETAAD